MRRYDLSGFLLVRQVTTTYDHLNLTLPTLSYAIRMSRLVGLLCDHLEKPHTPSEPPRPVTPSSTMTTSTHSFSKPNPPAYKHRTLVLISAIIGYFVFAYDNTVIANIRPNIVADLGNIEDLPVLSVTYSLGTFAVNLFWGRLYRGWDGKWLFCIAILVFEVGVALCGAAPSMGALIAGRVVAGLGELRRFATGKEARMS